MEIHLTRQEIIILSCAVASGDLPPAVHLTVCRSKGTSMCVWSVVVELLKHASIKTLDNLNDLTDKVEYPGNSV